MAGRLLNRSPTVQNGVSLPSSRRKKKKNVDVIVDFAHRVEQRSRNVKKKKRKHTKRIFAQRRCTHDQKRRKRTRTTLRRRCQITHTSFRTSRNCVLYASTPLNSPSSPLSENFPEEIVRALAAAVASVSFGRTLAPPLASRLPDSVELDFRETPRTGTPPKRRLHALRVLKAGSVPVCGKCTYWEDYFLRPV